ncbi:MAG: [FeFe] hydrogenase H-cluster maturation GTPase HydF [Eubacteriaceae bacterium]|nr:[FeFe] hydrogenase H-cluster maturation GTPase HydF [Eubacteriaceae bacterium]
MAREISDSKSLGGSDLNSTPSGNRVHISFFGRRNAGKSSLVNAVTGQNLSIVSDTPGTTTDPVSKAMELLPLGPVVITDTAGLDDEGVIGEMRVAKAMTILRKTDIAVLVVDGSDGSADADAFTLAPDDEELIELFRSRNLPFLLAINKKDKIADVSSVVAFLDKADYQALSVSAATGEGINELKEKIAAIGKEIAVDKKIIADRLNPQDVVILVTPIDSSAPKGRMILPQVQAIRDILDGHAVCMVTQVEELQMCLNALKEPPALVVTDSQAFSRVKEIVPESVKLTSFSILFARLKGILNTAVEGAEYLSRLNEGDRVLISEGCTHHRQCEDIGTVKLPRWIENNCGKKLNFSFTSGGQFPEADELKQYALVVHCGGCMLNEREMLSRMHVAEDNGVAFTNYGTLIAHMNGILERSLEFLK